MVQEQPSRGSYEIKGTLPNAISSSWNAIQHARIFYSVSMRTGFVDEPKRKMCDLVTEFLPQFNELNNNLN